MATNIKSKSKKLTTLVTPDGVAAFAYLREPDERFGDPKFRINVFFDIKDAKVKKFYKLLKKLENAWRVENKRKPKPAKALAAVIKRADEKLAKLVGVEVGATYIKFDTNPRINDDGGFIRVPVIGANGKATSTPVYGTDLVAIETNISGWTTPQGLGIKCYLSAVQLLESRYEGANAGGKFGVREDFLNDDDDDESGPDIEEDDLLDDESGADLDLDEVGKEDPDANEAGEGLCESDDPAAGLV